MDSLQHERRIRINAGYRASHASASCSNAVSAAAAAGAVWIGRRSRRYHALFGSSDDGQIPGQPSFDDLQSSIDADRDGEVAA